MLSQFSHEIKVCLQILIVKIFVDKIVPPTDNAHAYFEVFLSETGLGEGPFLSFSISGAWSLQLFLINQALWVLTFTKESFIITGHGFQDLIISGEQDSVAKLVQS